MGRLASSGGFVVGEAEAFEVGAEGIGPAGILAGPVAEEGGGDVDGLEFGIGEQGPGLGGPMGEGGEGGVVGEGAFADSARSGAAADGGDLDVERGEGGGDGGFGVNVAVGDGLGGGGG